MRYCLNTRKHIPLVAFFSLLLIVGLFSPFVGPNMSTDVHAASMTIKVKYEESTPYNPKAGSGNVYARWEILSTTAYMDDAKERRIHCVQPSKFANKTATTYTIDQDYADDGTGKYAIIRKLLYYSYGYGKFNTEGRDIYEKLDLLGNDNGLCATHVALSVVYADDDNPYLGAEKWEANGKIEELINRINQLDPPPASFRVFIIKQQGYQDMMGAYYHAVPGKLKVQKDSADTSITKGNSCYSLAGAEYGVYTNPGCTVAAKDINGNTIRLVTDKNGTSQTVSVDPGTYYVKELKASPGYLISTEKPSHNIGSGGGATFYVKEKPGGDPLAMLVQKKDSGTADGKPHQSFTLEGAIFRVTYYPGYFDTEDAAKASGLKATEWKFKTDADGYADYRDKYKVEGPALWKYNGDPQLPYGTAFIQEIAAPDGYTVNGQVHVRKISPNNPGQPATGNPVTVNEDIIRGDLSFIKAQEGSLKRMGNVPFLLTNTRTGEAHVIVTDENGEFNSTSYRDQPANANDACVDGDKVINEEGLNYQSPVWFGEGTYDATKGSLIPGEYTMTELACKANEDHALIDVSFTVDEAHVKVDLATITNRPINPKIKSKALITKRTTTITDQVTYENLIPEQEYTLKSSVYCAEINGIFKGVTGEKTFIPKSTDGTVEVSIDATKASGRTVVVFEELYLDGKVVASDKNKNNKDQTVDIPSGTITFGRPGTGDSNHAYFAILVMMIALLSMVAAWRRKEHEK